MGEKPQYCKDADSHSTNCPYRSNGLPIKRPTEFLWNSASKF